MEKEKLKEKGEDDTSLFKFLDKFEVFADGLCEATDKWKDKWKDSLWLFGTIIAVSSFLGSTINRVIFQIPEQRKEVRYTAWGTISSAPEDQKSSAGRVDALNDLTKGCVGQRKTRWMPRPLARRVTHNCAELKGLTVKNAYLRGVKLDGADLQNADLQNADLQNAELSGADLTGSILVSAKLHGADLSGAVLYGVDLGCIKKGTSTEEVEIINCEPKTNADLSGVNLSSADLRTANLTGANLTNANLSNAKLNGANLIGADLTGAILFGAQLINPSPENLHQSTLARAFYNDQTRFPNEFVINSSGLAGLIKIDQHADLAGIDLRNADLGESSLYCADLRRADLRGANLENIFSKEKGSEEDLKISFKETIYDEKTVFPKDHKREFKQARKVGNLLRISPGANLAGVNLSLGNQEASEGASSSQEQESDCREQRDSQQLEVKKTSATKEGENTPEQLRSEAKETIEESRIVKCPNFANPGEKDIVASDCRRDLSHAKLSEANLRKANLNGVILTGADLRQAKLQGATLFGTDLSNADLSNANLTGALYNDQTQFPQDFDPESAKACRIAPKADLRQCKNNIEGLEDLNLRQVNLSKADLRGVDLTKADLTDADLSEALFTDRNLLPKSVSDEMRHKMYEIAPRGELIRVDLRELNLEEADLTEAILTRADLRGTNLSNVILTGTNLEGALYDSRTQFPEDFSKKGKGMYEIVAYSKELTGADLSDVILQLVDLRGVDFKDVDLKGTKLIGADLRSADLSKAKNFDDESTSFDKAIYDDKTKFPDGFNRKGLFKIAPGNNEDKGKGLTQAQLDSRDLKKADLSEADLTGASLRDSILIEANLSRATLVEASLERANLSDADLTCADLEGADLRGIRNWTKGQIEAAKNFRKAYYDEDTRKKLNIQRPDQESDDTDTSPEFENKNACKGESNN